MPYKHKRILKEVLSKAIEDLKMRLEENNGIILVEGKHDIKVLELLGFPETFIVSYSSRGLEDTLSKIKGKEPKVIYLFMDRDSAGEHITHKVMSYLSRFYKTVNVWTLLDKRLKKLGFKTIRKVEELKSLANKNND